MEVARHIVRIQQPHAHLYIEWAPAQPDTCVQFWLQMTEMTSVDINQLSTATPIAMIWYIVLLFVHTQRQ